MSIEATPASELLVSVVVPVRDRVGALERVIEALAVQTLGRERFEVIIAEARSSPAVLCSPSPMPTVYPRRTGSRPG